MAGVEGHLYCSVCALEAVKQHSGRGLDAGPPQFLAVPSGEVTSLGGDVWEVPRAHVVFRGASLCLFHMATALGQELGDAQP